jgi:hypothetical protein
VGIPAGLLNMAERAQIQANSLGTHPAQFRIGMGGEMLAELSSVRESWASDSARSCLPSVGPNARSKPVQGGKQRASIGASRGFLERS